MITPNSFDITTLPSLCLSRRAELPETPAIYFASWQKNISLKNRSDTMTIVKWLNDNGILISPKLSDAMAEFEYLNRISINDESVIGFFQEVIKFIKQLLRDSDTLGGNVCRVDIIHDIILNIEVQMPNSTLQMSIHRMLFKASGQVRDFQIGDETDRLMIEIIRCVTDKMYNTAL